MQRRFIRVAGAALALVLLAGACGGGDKIGSDKDLANEGTTKGCESGAIGGCTTTIPKPAGTTTTAKPAPTTTQRAVATTRSPTTATISLTININDDDKGPYYDPRTPQMYVNTTVRFTNKPGNERSYVVTGTYSDGSVAFVTKSLKPGESQDIRLTKPGQIKLGDDLADYRVGYITVSPR